MPNEIIPASKELQDADAALRRAAIGAKKLAEKQGTPYVVYDATIDTTVNKTNSQSNK